MGFIWIVKGYQHPPGKVFAFPRYNIISRSKSIIMRHRDSLYYWDCLKLEAPAINAEKAILYKPNLSHPISSIIKSVESLLDLDEEEYVVTGSILIGANRDIDIVVYGVSDFLIDKIRDLVNKGVFEKADLYTLYKEYLAKHKGRVDLDTYLSVKKDTLLHLRYRGYHLNLRLVRFKQGVQKCVDPVFKRVFFIDEITIVKPLDYRVIPSRYLVEVRGRELYLETYRELYAELKPGKYYVEGFLEYRRGGGYIVPDHGLLKLINIKD